MALCAFLFIVRYELLPLLRDFSSPFFLVPSELHGTRFFSRVPQRVGEHRIDDSKKMTAARCAELVAAAVAHKLDEAWSVLVLLLHCLIS